MLKLYRAYEYFDFYKDLDGSIIPNNQTEIGEVFIDDTIDIKTLKRYLKKLFGLKSNIRLNSLQVDWNLDIIIVEYVTRYGIVPIGYLNLVDDSDSEEEELTVANW